MSPDLLQQIVHVKEILLLSKCSSSLYYILGEVIKPALSALFESCMANSKFRRESIRDFGHLVGNCFYKIIRITSSSVVQCFHLAGNNIAIVFIKLGFVSAIDC